MRKYVCSGSIWEKPARQRAQIIRRVCESLVSVYGSPRLGNPEDPVDDMVYIIISNKTQPAMAGHVFGQLKKRFHAWEDAMESRKELQSILRPAGLSTVKTEHILAALRRIRDDSGTCNLQMLRGFAESDAEKYLLSLPGVSVQVAKCVMMYTLGFRVLSVDAHVHRIAGRLGWTSRKRADQCHDELESLVPNKYRYSFHVDCIEHGRAMCHSTAPDCGKCVLRKYCEFSRGSTCTN